MNMLIKSIKGLVRDRSYKLLRNHLRLNVFPGVVKLYAEPYADAFMNYQYSKNRIVKAINYLQWFRSPLVVPQKSNIHYAYFRDQDQFLFMKQMWECNCEYTKTKRFSEFKERIDRGSCIHRKMGKYNLYTEGDFRAYFADYEAMLISMHKYGYNYNIEQDPILVWVGPSGELIKEKGGRHRMAAAIVTGVYKIPVEIKYVHETWVRSRILSCGKRSREITTGEIRESLIEIHEIYGV